MRMASININIRQPLPDRNRSALQRILLPLRKRYCLRHLCSATGQVAYTNTGGVNRFSNVTISPYRVNFGTGQSVVLSFTTTTAGTFQIHTNNLTPVSANDFGRYLYLYCNFSGRTDYCLYNE